MPRFQCNKCGHKSNDRGREPWKCPTCGPTKWSPVEERVLWKFPSTKPAEKLRELRNCPAVDGEGRVFAALQNGLVAFEPTPEGCNVIWTYVTGSHIASSPVLGSDGNIRVHSADGELHLVKSSTGEPRSSPLALGEPLPHTNPLVDVDGTTWICGYRELLRVDANGQKGERYFRPSQRFDCTGLIDTKTLFVGSNDYCVYAIDLTGPVGENTWDHHADHGRTGFAIHSALAIAGPLIIVASGDDHLYAFDEDGTLAWREEMGGQLRSAPVSDGEGNVYIAISQAPHGGAGTGALACISGTSHKVRWKYEVDACIESTPVIGDDGLIYFGDNAGDVHAVNTQNGDGAWKANAGTAVRSLGTLIAKEMIAFGTADGQLVALKCTASGLLLSGWPKALGNLANSARQ